MRRLSTDEFVIRASKMHCGKYDYSKSEYVNSRTKIKIICPIHGLFWQKANKHLLGSGCNICGWKKTGMNCRFTQEEFLKLCKRIHKNTYDYSQVKYVDCRDKIQIGCKKHGLFWQSPVSHIHQRHGCPRCKRSKGELAVENWLQSKKISYVSQKKFDDLTNGKRGWGLRYDFYLPSYDLLIEVDGIGHYRCGIGRWVGKHKITSSDYKQIRKNDNLKTSYASKNNITLLRIPYTNQKDKDMSGIVHILEQEI